MRQVALAALALLLAACGSASHSQTVGAPSTAATESVALGSPEGLVFGPDGNLYVSSCTAGTVVRADASGTLALVAGVGGVGDTAGDGGAATEAQFGCPAGLAFDGAGRLYITDHLGNRIRMVDETGTISTVVGAGPIGHDEGDLAGDGGPALKSHLNEPIGIAFDAQGRLYIGDRDNARIRRVDADGIIDTIAGTRRGFSGDGGPATKAQLADPYYFVFDHANLFICDSANGRVRRVDRNGMISTIVAHLQEPYGIALGQEGSLYVSVAGNQVVQIARDGHTHVVAGSGEDGFSGDGGPATDAALSGPAGLVVDAAGNLYIADSGNDRVREVAADGTISTFAGP